MISLESLTICCFAIAGQLLNNKFEKHFLLWHKLSLSYNNFTVLEFQDLITNNLPLLVNGILRNKTLYDFSVSFDESLYGLYMLLDKNRHNNNINPETLHNLYIESETILQKQNRKPKNMSLYDMKITSLELIKKYI